MNIYIFSKESQLSLAGICVMITIMILCHIARGEEAMNPTKSMSNTKTKYEKVVLKEEGTSMTLNIAWMPVLEKHPAILMLGSIKEGETPPWSKDLVSEGYMLVAFTVEYPPDPDPGRRPVWLFFDQRFAHMYTLLGKRCIHDTERVIEYLAKRGDVDTAKIGWLGSSTTGIPALAVATQGPRLAAIVVFVSTGSYTAWFETWQTNQLWRGTTPELWPETLELLKEYDPILHVDRMYPTALLMVNGGLDTVVDPEPVRSFVGAARPYYEKEPERLRLVIYEGFGHNLPIDIIKMYAEHWFHLYMSPEKEESGTIQQTKDLRESVIKTQINPTSHEELITGTEDSSVSQ